MIARPEYWWIDQFKKKDAFFLHDGKYIRPHPLLTSGKHSNGFVNCRLVIPDEALLFEAASDLLIHLVGQGGAVSEIQGVVGPQTGATRLAELLKHQVTALTQLDCFSASPAKKEIDGKKSMVFDYRDFRLLARKSILPCEDVLTTGGSVDLTIKAVEDGAGIILPFVLALVNRSGKKEVSGKKIIALIEKHMPIWDPEECPLCKEGSEAIRPKGENWARLNASY